MRVLVRGAGVAGLTAAHELEAAGAEVTVADVAAGPARGASRFAGGMLAPYCERESAEEPVLTLGRAALGWWRDRLPGLVHANGTLVVAPGRDRSELGRFAARTSGHVSLDADAIAALEPDLGGRFAAGLFFADEGHLDPRLALATLEARLGDRGVRFVLGPSAGEGGPGDGGYDVVVDCTGLARASTDSELRGVRGEMLVLRTNDVALSRPVRLLHPRIPVYVVPRGEGVFMVGATMIETDRAGPISARSMMELLNAAYALDPAFGEAEIVETGTGVRPAYPDNLPRVYRDGAGIVVNGLYRHGFLLAPWTAREAVRLAFERDEQMESVDEADRERSIA